MSDDVEISPDGKAQVSSRLRAIGERAISYALGLSLPQVKLFMSDGIELAPLQLEAAKKLHQALETLVSRRDVMQSLLDIDYINFASLRYTQSEQSAAVSSHVLNVWRQTIIGMPDYLNKSDELLTNFLRICIDAYPAFLLPPQREYYQSNGLHTISGDLIDDFRKTVRTDVSITKLLPVGEVTDYTSLPQFFTSSGIGTRIQLHSLHVDIVMNSYRLMRLRNEHSLDGFLLAAKKTIGNLRALLLRDIVEVPNTLIFDGIALPEGTIVSTSLGEITCLHEGLAELLPDLAKPTKLNGDQMGVALTNSLPFEITFADDDSAPKNRMKSNKLRLKYIKEKFSFAVALIAQNDRPFSAKYRARIEFDPITAVNTSYSGDSGGHLDYAILEAEQIDELVQWCNLLSDTELEKVSISINRFMSALIHRQNPTDAFIDGVIALENLFGARAEIAFSIATSVAKLIGQGIDDKEQIFSEVKQLYNLRSSVLHGGKVLSSEEAFDARNKVLVYLKSCFVILLSSRQDLIDMSSSNRVKSLALDLS